MYYQYMPKSKRYEESDHELQLVQNAAIRENTRITWLTLWVSIVVGIFSAISAVAEILQLYG